MNIYQTPLTKEAIIKLMMKTHLNYVISTCFYRDSWWFNLPSIIKNVDAKLTRCSDGCETHWFTHTLKDKEHRAALFQDMSFQAAEKIHAVTSGETYKNYPIHQICSELVGDGANLEEIEMPPDFYFFTYSYEDPRLDYDLILSRDPL